MEILLAEDDDNIASIVTMALKHVGHHNVTWVSNGELALKELLKTSYDLVLLDHMMPIYNGLTVCKKYHEQINNPSPVIFLSAKSQHDDVQSFESQGAGFIQKPFDPMTLCHQIDAILKTPKENAA